MSKKLLYITTRLPWPQNNGRKVTLYNYCKGLNELCDYEIYLYSFLDSGQKYNSDEKPEFIHEVQIAMPISRFEKGINLARVAFDSSEPFQNALYYSKANAANIKKFANQVNPDAVIVDMVRLAPYLQCFNDIDCLKSLDIDDLLSRRYERQSTWEGTGNFLGMYADKTNIVLKKLSALRKSRNKVLKIESKRMALAEKKYANRVDNVFFVSPADASEFSKIAGYEKTSFAAGMGADVDYFSEDVVFEKRPGIVSFVGNLSFDANVSSVAMILDEILPRLSHKCKLEVIGDCPLDIQEELIKKGNVEFLGRVPDFRPVIRSTDIFLAPIAYGSGIKTKIVEAMAMGMCVVTNSIGAEGLTAKNGVEIVIEDEVASLVSCVDSLLADEASRNRLGIAAQQYAARNHKWSNLLMAFKDNGF